MIAASTAHAIARGMSKRLEFLLKLTAKSEDPFAWYGLAMEYRSLSRFDECVGTFERLRARSPEYVPMYLMCGQVLESIGRTSEARAWFESGIASARAKGDAHAASELQGALVALDDEKRP
jgi:tetratricopeptide (TPR) repeat protein